MPNDLHLHAQWTMSACLMACACVPNDLPLAISVAILVSVTRYRPHVCCNSYVHYAPYVCYIFFVCGALYHFLYTTLWLIMLFVSAAALLNVCFIQNCELLYFKAVVLLRRSFHRAGNCVCYIFHLCCALYICYYTTLYTTLWLKQLLYLGGCFNKAVALPRRSFYQVDVLSTKAIILRQSL